MVKNFEIHLRKIETDEIEIVTSNSDSAYNFASTDMYIGDGFIVIFASFLSYFRNCVGVLLMKNRQNDY